MLLRLLLPLLPCYSLLLQLDCTTLPLLLFLRLFQRLVSCLAPSLGPAVVAMRHWSDFAVPTPKQVPNGHRAADAAERLGRALPAPPALGGDRLDFAVAAERIRPSGRGRALPEVLPQRPCKTARGHDGSCADRPLPPTLGGAAAASGAGCGKMLRLPLPLPPLPMAAAGASTRASTSAPAKALPTLPALGAQATGGAGAGTAQVAAAGLTAAVGDRALPQIACARERTAGATAAVGARELPTLHALVEAAERAFGPPPGRRGVKRRVQKKGKPCWRRNARDDLENVASLYGADLGSADTARVPRDWLDPAMARQVLLEAGMAAEEVHVLEVYAGTGNWTSACQEAGLKAGPRVDKLTPGGVKWDLLEPKCRRLLWAVAVVCRPKWIHSGFPCTFWTQLAHLTRKKTESQNESDRLRELVHVVFTCQLAMWQISQKRHVSLENPPACASWCLDIVTSTLAATGATKVVFDSCAWGHRDPGNGKPYKKSQCIASTADLSKLIRHCSCGKQVGIHQRVEGMVSILLPGHARKMRRSTFAGAYPKQLCTAWANIVRAAVTRAA